MRLLLRMLRPDATDVRKRWFADVHACRRRPPLRPDRLRAGGLEGVFGVADEFGIVLRHATHWRLGREMASRELGSHEARAAAALLFPIQTPDAHSTLLHVSLSYALSTRSTLHTSPYITRGDQPTITLHGPTMSLHPTYHVATRASRLRSVDPRRFTRRSTRGATAC